MSDKEMEYWCAFRGHFVPELRVAAYKTGNIALCKKCADEIHLNWEVMLPAARDTYKRRYVALKSAGQGWEVCDREMAFQRLDGVLTEKQAWKIADLREKWEAEK